MNAISIKRKLATTVSCSASPITNTLTPKTINYDVIYLKPGSSGLAVLSIYDYY